MNTPQTTIATTTPSPQVPIEQSLCCSNRDIPKPDYWLLNDPSDQAIITCDVVMEPNRYHEAIMSRDGLLWQVEMLVEIDQHAEIGTWEVVELPEGRKPIGFQWVYAVKTTLEGEFEKSKARIVVQASHSVLEWITMK